MKIPPWLRRVCWLAAVALAFTAHAQTWVYTFESETLNTVTPLSLAPESGPTGFTTNFTTPGPLTDAFEIEQYNAALPPTYMSGQSLMFNLAYAGSPGSLQPPQDLTLTFSQPVNSVSLNVLSPAGINAVTTLGDGHVFSADTVATSTDNAVPTYLVDFAPASPFSSLTLHFTSDNSTVVDFIVIDNVTITAIPEPASVAAGLALFALGAVGVREHWRRRQQQAA